MTAPGIDGVSLAEQLQELRRERKMRVFVYPRLIGGGKMKPEDAERYNRALDAAIATLDAALKAAVPATEGRLI